MLRHGFDHARGEAPHGYIEAADETTVEYDENVLAELDRTDDIAWEEHSTVDPHARDAGSRA
jgi:hypothetical protein